MTEQQDRDQFSPEEQVKRFEEEATAAKRSHGEPPEWVVDTETDEDES